MKRWLKTWVIAAFVLCLLAAQAISPAFGQSQPVTGTVEFTHTVNGELIQGQETSASVLLLGRGDAACQGIPKRPVDTMLVFDISTSAGMGPGSNWEKTVNLTLQLLNSLGQPVYLTAASLPEVSRTALIVSQTGQSGPEPLLLQDLTHDHNLLHNLVSQLTPTGDTDIAAGIILGLEKLKASKDTQHNQAIILMMHDNVPLNPATESAIKEAVSQQVPVYMVVNDLNLKPEQVINQEQATEMVQPEHLVLHPDPASLRAMFLNMTGGAAGLAARAVDIHLSILPPDQVDVVAVNGTNGQITANQITWLVDELKVDEKVELGYAMRLRPSAAGPFDFQVEMNWIDCSGFPVLGFRPLNSAAAVQPTTPTPASGPPPASVTPTPYPAHGTGLPLLFQDQDLGIPLLGLWPLLPDWLWLLLLLLLLLLLAWLLLFLLRRRAPPIIDPPPPHPPVPGLIPPPIHVTPVRPPTGEPHVSDWQTTELGEFNQAGLLLRTRSSPPTNTEVTANLRLLRPVRFIARIDRKGSDQPIGRAEIELSSTKTQDPITGMERIIVFGRWTEIDIESAWRRKRLGSLLVNALEKKAQQNQVRYLDGVIPAQANSPAILPFFVKMGYRHELTPTGNLLKKDLPS